MNLKELQDPIDHKYRVQQAKEYGANIVAYIDSRDVQQVLDDVCCPENWQVKYEREPKGGLFAHVGILCNGEWVWKSDVGTESEVEKEKGEASDAFKRAAVMWGIGRFLYDLPIIHLKTKQNAKGKYDPVDEKGAVIKPWDITRYCMNRFVRDHGPYHRVLALVKAKAITSENVKLVLAQNGYDNWNCIEGLEDQKSMLSEIKAFIERQNAIPS